MKVKKILVGILLLVSTITMQAQISKGDLFVAPTLGLNIASINMEGTSSIYGVVIGATGEYGINNKMSLSASALFSMQGEKWDSYDDSKDRLNYLNIPLTVNYYVWKGLSFHVGLQPGVLLSAKQSYDGESESIKEYTNSFDISLPFGVSYCYNNIEMSLRYALGVTSAFKDEVIESGTPSNRVASIQLKYKFKLNK